MMTEEDARRAARLEYASDEIDVDEDARVVFTIDGAAWVAAWVYIEAEGGTE